MIIKIFTPIEDIEKEIDYESIVIIGDKKLAK